MSQSEEYGWKLSNLISNSNYKFDREEIINICGKENLVDALQVISNWENYIPTPLINLDELSKLSFLNDLIIISAMKKKNLGSQNINGRFANIRYVQNSCSDMSMDVVKINDLGDFSLL